jgi:hypothetical protein
MKRHGILFSLCCALVLTAHVPSADADLRGLFTRRAAQPAANATFKERAKAFQKAPVSPTTKSKANNKLIMTVKKGQQKQYAKSMKDTVEVIFAPGASRYGHLYIRVGERLYDVPGGRGPGGLKGPAIFNNRAFKDKRFWGATYGFVFKSNPGEVAKLQKEYEAVAKSGAQFSIAGTGCGSYSCAGFVTSVLNSKAPQLQIGKSGGAISASRSLLRSGKHDAITLYSSAVDAAKGESFSFEKIE